MNVMHFHCWHRLTINANVILAVGMLSQVRVT